MKYKYAYTLTNINPKQNITNGVINVVGSQSAAEAKAKYLLEELQFITMIRIHKWDLSNGQPFKWKKDIVRNKEEVLNE